MKIHSKEDTTFRLFWVVEFDEIQSISYDGRGNWLFLNGQGMLYKCNAESTSIEKIELPFDFNGSYIDASDPYQILIFSVASERALLLNRWYTPIQELSFQELSFIPSIVCRGDASQLWLYTPLENEVWSYFPQNQSYKFAFELDEALEEVKEFRFFHHQLHFIALDGAYYRYDSFGRLVHQLEFVNGWRVYKDMWSPFIKDASTFFVEDEDEVIWVDSILCRYSVNQHKLMFYKMN